MTPEHDALVERLTWKADILEPRGIQEAFTDWASIAREFREAAQAIAALSAEVARRGTAVEIAATVFEEYAQLHRKKGTPDGEAKAVRNDQYAAEMRAALRGTGRAEVAE